MWSDNETLTDLVGFRVHADLIREVVTDSKLLPVTIGVFGDWGSGKTSIMHMLRRDLDAEDESNAERAAALEGVVVIYFNGWLFEGYDDAKSALLTSILAQLAEHQRFGPRVRDKAVALLKRVNWMRVAKLGFTEVALPAVMAYATGGISAVPTLATLLGKTLGGTSVSSGGGHPSEPSKDGKKPDLKDLIQEAPESDPTDVRSFREDFGEMLKESTIQTLVVLIDDLDRCSPERIIENLEAIKLFLNVENTAFVIGADPRIVRHAIAVRYKDAVEAAGKDGAEQAERLITDYIEKLIQVPYHLPRLSPAEIETYMVLLFCQRDLPEGDFQRCVDRCEHERNKNRYGRFGLADVKAVLGGIPLPPALEVALTFSTGASGLITEGLKGNPRQVKRFLNAWLLRKKLASVAKLDGIKDEVLIKLMLLEYAEEKRFKELFELQATEKGHPELLRKLEADGTPKSDAPAAAADPSIAPEWKTDRILRWAAMDPKLADVDLSDYFWLARDRLASTLSGLSLTPPGVRRVFEALQKPPTRRATATSAKDLSPDDLGSLHQLLTNQILRQPDQKQGYDIFRALIEAGIASTPAFVEVLMTVPLAKIPPAIHADLTLLVKGHADAAAPMFPVFTRFADAKGTKIGEATAQAAKGASPRPR